MSRSVTRNNCKRLARNYLTSVSSLLPAANPPMGISNSTIDSMATELVS